MNYHEPVLLAESINGLNIQKDGVYADLTFGGGGHSGEILKRLGEKGRLLAFDQDSEAALNVVEDKRMTFVHANFRFLKNFLRYLSLETLDGVLADLGISSHQIDKEERGFAFRTDTLLDMRMNSSANKTAADILNDYEPEKLIQLLKNYGELRGAHRFVQRLTRLRADQRIERSGQLVEMIDGLVPPAAKNKTLAKIFQALRIEVNDEMGALKEMLEQLPGALKPGGRLVILSYHSIEDRMVKNLVRTGNTAGEMKKDFYGNPETCFKAINRGVITAGEEETARNPRARSAKLRIAEKL